MKREREVESQERIKGVKDEGKIVIVVQSLVVSGNSIVDVENLLRRMYIFVNVKLT